MTGESSIAIATPTAATTVSAPTFRLDPLRHIEQTTSSPQSQSDGSLYAKLPNTEQYCRLGTPTPMSISPSPTISIRPRSLFTSHSSKGHENGSFPSFSEFSSKYSPRGSNPRNWSSPQMANMADSINLNCNYEIPYPFPINRGSGFSPVYFDLDEDFPAYYWHEQNGSEESIAIGATVTSQGIISLRLHSDIQVDITIDKGIRVLNNRSHIIISLSPDGNSSALIHPSGMMYAYGSRVEITTTDCNGNTKFAKMFYKGVSFTSDTSALIYLVDQAGTRTTSDTFSDLGGDFSIPVFLQNAHFGSHMVRECTKILRQCQYWITEDGTENWVVNGIRVSQTPDGLVRVGRGTSKYQIRTSPLNGTATITTPSVHCTASVGVPTPGGSAGPHLFVKRGERRLHSDGLTFIVRNAGHASGFDEYNQLKVY